MTKAFLVTGGDQFDALWRVVLSIHKSQLDWVYETFLGLLVNAADPKAWITGGESTPEEAAAIFEQILKDIVMYPDMLGSVMLNFRTTVPAWALPCDGATHLKADYPDLYAVLSPALIVDSTHFKTPDMEHARMIRGTITPTQYGINGGSDSITITNTNLPAHTHTEITAVPALGAAMVGVPIPSAVPGVGVTGSAGAGGAFNVTPQHVKCGFIMVAKYP